MLELYRDASAALEVVFAGVYENNILDRDVCFFI